MRFSRTALVAVFSWSMVGGAIGKEMTLRELLAAENTTLSMLNGLLATLPTLLTTLETTSNITILAPNNAAFISYLSSPNNAAVAADPVKATALLQYHILPTLQPSSYFGPETQFFPTLLTDPGFANVTGGQVVEGIRRVGKVKIISGVKEESTLQTSDLKFSNGVLHIIDTVLTVPIKPSFSALDSNLTAFGGALAQARFYHALDEMRDITVFAPSNAAFQAISSTASSLSPSALQTLLQYHIIPNNILRSPSLLSLALNPTTQNLQTLNGATLKVQVVNSPNGGLFVNSARVIERDVLVGNGVLYVLDGVLNPENAAVPPDPGAKTQAPVFGTAGETGLVMGNVPFTAGIVATTTAPSARQTGTARRVEGKLGVAMLCGFGAVGLIGL